MVQALHICTVTLFGRCGAGDLVACLAAPDHTPCSVRSTILPPDSTVVLREATCLPAMAGDMNRAQRHERPARLIACPPALHPTAQFVQKNADKTR
jgi:hypothetical protein